MNFDTIEQEETSMSYLIRLDAFITDSIDMLSQAIEDTEPVLQKAFSGL